jgi:2-hydroxychromene-2-carboxylate isomerase
VATFYFDFASPLSYLAAERVLGVLPEPAEWQPVLLSELVIDIGGDGDPAARSRAHARAGARARAAVLADKTDDTTDTNADGNTHVIATADSAADGTLAELGPAALRAEVERRAGASGLPALRWPQPFPFDSTYAMLVATYAGSIGRAVAFAQAAFRQAYAGGRNLEERDNVLIAAAACEMHPKAVLKAVELRSTDGELRKQTARAARAGVRTLPAVTVGPHVYAGEAALERAATHMRASARATASR